MSTRTLVISRRIAGNVRHNPLAATGVVLVVVLVILALFGAGFALHLLWWVAIVALVVLVVGFFIRR